MNASIDRQWVTGTTRFSSDPLVDYTEAHSETSFSDLQPAELVHTLMQQEMGTVPAPFNPNAHIMTHMLLRLHGHLQGDALGPYLICGACPIGWTWLDSLWTCCSFCAQSFFKYELQFRLWPGCHTREGMQTNRAYKREGKGSS